MDHKFEHSSGSYLLIFDLTTDFDRSFYGEHACNLQEARKFYFRLVSTGSMSGVETMFLTWTHKSRFFSKTKSGAIAGSIPSSRTLDCAQDGPSITSFNPLRPDNEVLFDFMVETYFVVSRLITCNRLLFESFLAETISCRSAASLKFGLDNIT